MPRHRFGFDAAHPSGLGYVLPAWLQERAPRARLPPGPGDGGWRTVISLPLKPDMAVRLYTACLPGQTLVASCLTV